MSSSSSPSPTPLPPLQSTPIEFLSHLIHLTEQESLSESIESSLLLTNSPISLLVKNGLAITNLISNGFSISNTSLGGKTLVELKKNQAYGGGDSTGRFEPHDFRIGDLARIKNSSGSSSKKKSSSKNKGSSGKVVEEEEEGIDSVVYKVQNDKITLVLNNTSEDGQFEWSDRITILKISNPSTFKRQIHFLRLAIRHLEAAANPPPPSSDKIESDAIEREDSSTSSDEEDEDEDEQPTTAISPLLSVLLGISSPTIDEDDDHTHDLKFFDESLNDSQREAVEFSLKSRELATIWGPPGTGKTQTLVEIIKQLILNQHKRVLVCGASNLSVDNILLRLTTITPETMDMKIPLSRIGHPARILSSLIRHTLDSQSLTTDSNFLVKDIKSEILSIDQELSTRDKKTRLKGSERKRKYQELKDLRKDLKKRLKNITKEVLNDKLLILATCHGSGSKVLDKFGQFDVVIIDEAAQATEPACWIPIMRGKKLILAGDHLRLPPTLKSLSSSHSHKDDVDDDSTTTLSPQTTGRLVLTKTLETTLFSRLLSLHGNERIRKMLKIQYRFNDKLNRFPSRMLYDQELIPDETVRDRKLGDLLSLQQEEEEEGRGGDDDLEDLNEEIVFFDTAGLAMYEKTGEDSSGGFGSDSKSNENEVDIVLNYVRFLIDSKIPPTSISIISPYSSQVYLLSQTIHSLISNEIEIGSIDSNQGRENDVVIISLVRSNETGEIGFLKELRRLNVAMTRPRRQLVVVGDSETLKKQGTSNTTIDKKKKKKLDRKKKDVVNVEDEEEEEVDSTMDDQIQRTGESNNERKKQITGANYLKEWIEWLEENAYVRVP